MNVYESITAPNGHEKSKLFRRSKEHNVGVRPNATLPLSRAIVGDTLLVEAALLKDDDFLVQIASDDGTLATGRSSFML